MIEFYIKDIQSMLVDVDEVIDASNKQHSEIGSKFTALRTKLERAIKQLTGDISSATYEKNMANANLEHNRAVEAKILAEIQRIESEISSLENKIEKNDKEID